MPLIHFIDFYLTFKFCPLTKTGWVSTCLLRMCGMVIYIRGLDKGTESEVIAITEVHLRNIHNQDYKKQSFCVSTYVFGLRSGDTNGEPSKVNLILR